MPIVLPTIPLQGSPLPLSTPTLAPQVQNTALPVVKSIEVQVQPAGTALSLPFNVFRASTLIAAINAQGGTVTQVDDWTGTTWRTFVVGKGGTDFEIQAGTGYVVRGSSPSKWVAPVIAAAPKVTIKLTNGWAMIGAPICKDGAHSCYTATSLAKAINDKGGGVNQVSYMLNGQWIAYTVGSATGDFPITEGQGYFVRSTKASEWTP
jgi:hypothetical protein